MYNIKDMYVCMCPYCKECKETKHFIFLKPNACASKVKQKKVKRSVHQQQPLMPTIYIILLFVTIYDFGSNRFLVCTMLLLL